MFGLQPIRRRAVDFIEQIGGLARAEAVTILSKAIRRCTLSARGVMAEGAAEIAESGPLPARGEHNCDGRLPLVQK
jgi:hypothetical protein